MATAPQIQQSGLNNTYVNKGADPHRDSMLASLEHRLAVARDRQDARLITLLEQERRDLLAESPVQRLSDRLRAWWMGLQAAIARQNQLQVHEMHDGAGHRWWRAYDPHSGQEVYTDSESELLLWVEEHYSDRP